MCLDKVKKTYSPSDPKMGKKHGYKAFRSRRDLISPLFKGHVRSQVMSHRLKIGEWYESYVKRGERRVARANKRPYPLGFHVWRTKEAAQEWGGDVVCLVEYDRVVAEGTQETDENKFRLCDVALDMRIVKRVG